MYVGKGSKTDDAFPKPLPKSPFLNRPFEMAKRETDRLRVPQLAVLGSCERSQPNSDGVAVAGWRFGVAPTADIGIPPESGRSASRHRRRSALQSVLEKPSVHIRQPGDTNSRLTRARSSTSPAPDFMAVAAAFGNQPIEMIEEHLLSSVRISLHQLVWWASRSWRRKPLRVDRDLSRRRDGVVKRAGPLLCRGFEENRIEGYPSFPFARAPLKSAMAASAPLRRLAGAVMWSNR